MGQVVAGQLGLRIACNCINFCFFLNLCSVLTSSLGLSENTRRELEKVTNSKGSLPYSSLARTSDIVFSSKVVNIIRLVLSCLDSAGDLFFLLLVSLSLAARRAWRSRSLASASANTLSRSAFSSSLVRVSPVLKRDVRREFSSATTDYPAYSPSSVNFGLFAAGGFCSSSITFKSSRSRLSVASGLSVLDDYRPSSHPSIRTIRGCLCLYVIIDIDLFVL